MTDQEEPPWLTAQKVYAEKLRKERMACPKGGEHDYKLVDTEYGSLSDGGSYDIYDCTKCDKRSYSQLPD